MTKTKFHWLRIGCMIWNKENVNILNVMFLYNQDCNNLKRYEDFTKLNLSSDDEELYEGYIITLKPELVVIDDTIDPVQISEIKDNTDVKTFISNKMFDYLLTEHKELIKDQAKIKRQSVLNEVISWFKALNYLVKLIVTILSIITIGISVSFFFTIRVSNSELYPLYYLWRILTGVLS